MRIVAIFDLTSSDEFWLPELFVRNGGPNELIWFLACRYTHCTYNMQSTQQHIHPKIINVLAKQQAELAKDAPDGK
jgi:hypothetical protein